MIYERPRVSPDGRYVAAARQTGAVWRVVLIDLTGAAPPRTIGPDDGANRYDPAWRADGEHLVVVSEAGGVPNLEELDIARTPRARSRASRAPCARRSRAGATARCTSSGCTPSATTSTASRRTASPRSPPSRRSRRRRRFAPSATRPPVAADTFAVTPLTPQPYGFGPRTTRFLPAYSYGAEGSSVGGMLSGLDPVGRLTWMAQGFFGTPGSWQGGSAARGLARLPGGAPRGVLLEPRRPVAPVGIRGAGDAWTRPCPAASCRRAIDRAYVTNEQLFTARRVSLASFTQAGVDRARAGSRFGSWDGTFLAYVQDRHRVGAARRSSGATGRTDGEEWSRGTAALTLAASRGPVGIELGGSYGHADHASPAFELFSIGGTPPPFFETALYGQRIAMPALPAGLTTGNKMATLSVALPILGVRPYYWAGTTAASLNDWQEVAGLEAGIATDGIWFARIPGVRVLGGAGYALNGVWKYKTRVYLSVTFRP